MKQVKITIKGGKIKTDFLGFQGQDCKNLENKIRIEGLEVEDTEDKPELYATHCNTDTNTSTS